jgi:hypothetical protein
VTVDVHAGDFVQREGEIVYVPSMWHHAVLNLCDTVAVSDEQANSQHCHRNSGFCIDSIPLRSWVLTTCLAGGATLRCEQVTQNYCSRTNLRRCYAMATGQDPLVGAMGSGANTNELGCDDDASSTVAGLCPELQRQWLNAMLKMHPDIAAAHMPREWLQNEEIGSVDD